ncbi:hypothetical protein HMPREF0061_0833 [Aerococcus viridans ATCC 11563 = CCUG 4311]|uniref:Uncharacterized protein n=1 Tax=Aerococcus viridans (strain ATCC 11563 / DSM 20340 / CCUG 4311 / JCM 20461 / NBRC 12219 / NCTC 8251 / M1) TaxID=655812 RepID=A0ABP2I7A8_AERVM|nr:hypothetical protein HMPREF0061_0833 [Aerococcus viridans ATCC 11563 = CCUG 4311]
MWLGVLSQFVLPLYQFTVLFFNFPIFSIKAPSSKKLILIKKSLFNGKKIGVGKSPNPKIFNF